VKTGPQAVSLVQVNYEYDKSLSDPDELLDRYFTLTGWGQAARRAGAGRVAVVQRFHRSARLSRDGIEYVFCNARVPGLSRAVAGLGPDIAHVNGLIFPALTWMLRRMLPASTAVVVQNHSDGGAVGRAPFLRVAGRAARTAADAFLFAALEHAAAWRRAGLIARHQPIHQVMEASTTLQPMPRAVARTRCDVRGAPAVLWVGRLNANKDPLTVLDGFARSLADLPDAALTMIYSSDELLPSVREHVEQSTVLKDRVRLIGRVPHDVIAAYFSAADLFVLGSHHEGSGYSLMEASACGAVPVVTDIPTFRLLTGAAAGALWPVGDAPALARAMVDVARRDLSVERARLREHFARALSWDAIGRRAVEIYREVLRRRRSIDRHH